MKSGLIFRALIASGVILAVSGLAYGQDSAKPGANGSAAAPKRAVIKAHKVWTDDDMRSGRRADSLYVPTASVEGAGSATVTPPASASKETSAENSGPKGKPALSNPKTPAEADGMIEWEQRDIDAQQEFVDRMQAELEQALPERREHLQKVIAERQQALADTRREQQGLIAQKKELEKKASAKGSVTAAAQP